MKKLTLLLLSALLLVGCSNSNTKIPEDGSENPGVLLENVDYLYDVHDFYGDELDVERIFPMIGQPMLPLSATTLDRDEFDIKEFSRDSKVIVEVVAPWCSHCKEMEDKYLSEIVESLPKDVKFIQIFTGCSKEEAIEFIESAGIDVNDIKYPVVIPSDETEDWLDKMNIYSLPSLMFFDDLGMMTWIHEGDITPEDFNKVLNLGYWVPEKKIIQ